MPKRATANEPPHTARSSSRSCCRPAGQFDTPAAVPAAETPAEAPAQGE